MNYGAKDLKKLLMLGILSLLVSLYFLIMAIPSISNLVFSGNNYILIPYLLVMIIVTLIFGFIYEGYLLSVVKNTIKGQDEIPEFAISKNIINGAKVFVLNIGYYIPALLIPLIMLYVSGALGYLYDLAYYSIFYSGIATDIPMEIIQGGERFIGIIFISIIIFLVLFIIAKILVTIARAILAETDSLANAFQIKEIFHIIGKIGWEDYIIWWIVYIGILIAIEIIGTIIKIIPFIGTIIYALIITPYISIFESRVVGLLYNESKKN